MFIVEPWILKQLSLRAKSGSVCEIEDVNTLCLECFARVGIGGGRDQTILFLPREAKDVDISQKRRCSPPRALGSRDHTRLDPLFTHKVSSSQK